MDDYFGPHAYGYDISESDEPVLTEEQFNKHYEIIMTDKLKQIEHCQTAAEVFQWLDWHCGDRENFGEDSHWNTTYAKRAEMRIEELTRAQPTPTSNVGDATTCADVYYKRILEIDGLVRHLDKGEGHNNCTYDLVKQAVADLAKAREEVEKLVKAVERGENRIKMALGRMASKRWVEAKIYLIEATDILQSARTWLAANPKMGG